MKIGLILQSPSQIKSQSLPLYWMVHIIVFIIKLHRKIHVHFHHWILGDIKWYYIFWKVFSCFPYLRQKMVKAVNDAFNCVYRQYVTYYYNIILQNLIQNSVELYCNICELKRSDKGTDKNANMSLLRVYWRENIKYIDNFYEGFHFKVVSVNQKGGSGSHSHVVYQTDILEYFSQQDWILFNQPPQSHGTNVQNI